MVTGKQSGKRIRQRNQTQRDKRQFKREAKNDVKKTRRKTFVRIELPRKATESVILDTPKKVILRIPDTKSKQPKKCFGRITGLRNETEASHLYNMNDKITTDSDAKNISAEMNTSRTSNRRNRKDKRSRNFERQKVSV
ncbi:hypothetical protein TNCV_305481 [Trichonephila clavipes]|nr:hypothetical protein TNCV_305481 [Trichonephila clavipes]